MGWCFRVFRVFLADIHDSLFPRNFQESRIKYSHWQIVIFFPLFCWMPQENAKKFRLLSVNKLSFRNMLLTSMLMEDLGVIEELTICNISKSRKFLHAKVNPLKITPTGNKEVKEDAIWLLIMFTIPGLKWINAFRYFCLSSIHCLSSLSCLGADAFALDHLI